MRCKVRLTKLTKLEVGYELTYSPVSGGSPENDKFFKYTPYGEIKLGTVNDEVAKDLVPGRTYYVDFTEAM
jgi:hypothetical protein